jgi:hypothetical protein
MRGEVRMGEEGWDGMEEGEAELEGGGMERPAVARRTAHQVEVRRCREYDTSGLLG